MDTTRLRRILEGVSPRQVSLEEKLIVLNKGANYGTVCFMAGGGASGKGFVVDKFMDGNKFKIRDVDAWKLTFMKIDQLKGKYPEIRGLDLKKPEDVYKLHDFVDRLGIKDKTLDLLMQTLVPGRYPNLLFDITAKDAKSIFGVARSLVDAGYDPKAINIVWALTNYEIAVVRNKERSRVVPEDILFQAHTGAARTMSSILFGGKLDRSVVDGEVFVVLNNTEETKAYPRSANAASAKTMNVQSFTYAKLKKVGQPVALDDEARLKVQQWIDSNTPDPLRDPKQPIPLSKDA